ncbi:hypothetical protein L4D09_13160 [Photobacterium makurazakiensis]|uniref:hypothetical protein n=1 Tax=Photobacterium makurazakiensis TaxID=2910234 RepID=UPI003D13A648
MIRKELNIVLLGLSVISANTWAAGYDRVTTPDGFTCESSLDSDSTVEVYTDYNSGSTDYDQSTGWEQGDNANSTGNSGLNMGVKVTVPLFGAKKRVDCTRLYEMELMRLKAQIEASKKSQIEVDWGE